MIKYKHVQAANGRDMYFKNGNVIAKQEIPKGILNTLEPGVELEVSSGDEGTPPPQPAPAPEPEEEQEHVPNSAPPLENPGGTIDPMTLDGQRKNKAKSKKSKSANCIFCGEPATRTRFVNLQTADLCEDDYQSHTTGEIAAQMRKMSE